MRVGNLFTGSSLLVCAAGSVLLLAGCGQGTTEAEPPERAAETEAVEESETEVIEETETEAAEEPETETEVETETETAEAETVEEEKTETEAEPAEEAQEEAEVEIVEEAETETAEETEAAPEQTASTSGIESEFPIGTPLSELTARYGTPEYDEYFMGGRLVTFGAQDGYFLDDAESVYGYMITDPAKSIYGARIGMTFDEISNVYSQPSEVDYHEQETQDYTAMYSVDGFKIMFYGETEEGPTSYMMAVLVE